MESRVSESMEVGRVINHIWEKELEWKKKEDFQVWNQKWNAIFFLTNFRCLYSDCGWRQN